MSKRLNGGSVNLWDNAGMFTVCVIGVPEGEKECSTEEMFEEVMA